MKQFLLLFCLGALLTTAVAQPATEILLFDLRHNGEKLIATNGSNISAHKGYDNQPFFHPDKSVLYYTSADENGRTDIRQYDFQSGTTTAFTSTPEREYSPTVTPDKKYVSCIIQRDDGAQNLGKFPVNGGAANIIVDRLVVGYHAWLNESTLYLFVLGEPATLRRYTVGTGKDTILASNIGRSLHRVPGRTAVSFVQKSKDAPWTINQVDEDGNLSRICETLPEREDLAWMPDGWVLMSNGKAMFICLPGKTNWKEIGLVSDYPIKNISRIAVNASGTKLALVTEE